MTENKKILIGGALLQILLLGVLVTMLHTHLTMESLLGVLLLLGAEFVVYREVQDLKETHKDLAHLKHRPGSDPA